MLTVSLRPGLSQPRGRLPVALAMVSTDRADERALLVLGLRVEEDRIGGAVPHPFPVERVAGLDDARIVFRRHRN